MKPTEPQIGKSYSLAALATTGIWADSEVGGPAERELKAKRAPLHQPDYIIAYGSKYEDGRDVVAIAKLVRKAHRAAVKAGDLPACKVSLTIQRYSGGRSISATITAPPPGEQVLTPEGVAYRIACRVTGNPERRPDADQGKFEYTEAMRTTMAWLTDILRSYNYDGSDLQSDYFHVNYYTHIAVGWKLASAQVDAAMEGTDD